MKLRESIQVDMIKNEFCAISDHKDWKLLVTGLGNEIILVEVDSAFFEVKMKVTTEHNAGARLGTCVSVVREVCRIQLPGYVGFCDAGSKITAQEKNLIPRSPNQQDIVKQQKPG